MATPALERDRHRYICMWDAIAKRAAIGTNGREELTQAFVAKKLRADPAAVSRLFRAKGLSRDHGLLVKAAELYGASSEEIRVLLALASAISAAEKGDEKVAEYFRSMFKPLFPERAFTKQMNSSNDVAFNVLLEMNLDRESSEEIAIDVTAVTSPEDVLANVAKILASSDLPSNKLSTNFDLDKVLRSVKKFSTIVAPDFDVPWRKKVGNRFLMRAERSGGLRFSTLSSIPNVLFTKIHLHANKVATDSPHLGIEFLCLLSGKGTFNMTGVGDVAMEEDGRQFIAYQPNAKHTFTASDAPVDLFVVSYLRPTRDQDPIDEVIKNVLSSSAIPTIDSIPSLV